MMNDKNELIKRAEDEYEMWRERSGDYASRFCYELVELRDRCARLQSFLASGHETINRALLEEQLVAQLALLSILEQRFENGQL